jgi:hypothetical protein
LPIKEEPHVESTQKPVDIDNKIHTANHNEAKIIATETPKA